MLTTALIGDLRVQNNSQREIENSTYTHIHAQILNWNFRVLSINPSCWSCPAWVNFWPLQIQIAKFLEAELNFINEIPHLHTNQGLKTAVELIWKLWGRWGSSLISSFLASRKGETGFRYELHQLGLQEKQSELYRQERRIKLYLVTTKWAKCALNPVLWKVFWDVRNSQCNKTKAKETAGWLLQTVAVK